MILSFLNLFAPAAVGRMASLHLTLVTFTLFAVYTYRDIWPLMTFTLEVADKDEGSILWVKIALVAFTGVVEPMFEPYPYIPVDHKVIITVFTLSPAILLTFASIPLESKSHRQCRTNRFELFIPILRLFGSYRLACLPRTASIFGSTSASVRL